ncbi:hypothetical protein QVD17_03407 [Tagetes erecta]|uniref:Anaphase-promoting complex subunit 4 WD40 domain-containing protein n=1 Tax=Tagetes erecta TaxID=13708 RepID=A0AAD8P8M7_TARER|nr:hypothetical protein QVD17_03407 [Tagetes erecta]
MKVAWVRSLESCHSECVWSCTWASALLLTGSLDETVKLWDPEDLSLVRTNTGHCLGVVSVAAHPSGKIAASASIDSFIRVFDVQSNNTIATLEAPPSQLWQLQFDPRGSLLAVAGGSSGSVQLWDTAEWKLVSTLSIPTLQPSKPNNHFVLSVAWSPTGTQLACGSMDGSISVFDVQRAKFLHHLQGHTMPVRSLVYSPLDPTLVVSASDDECINMYDAHGKTLFSSMSGHSSWVLSVDISPDGAAIVSGSSDRTVKLWDPKMRAPIQTMTNHTDQVWGVKFQPTGTGTGTLLASVSDDKSISLYNYS